VLRHECWLGPDNLEKKIKGVQRKPVDLISMSRQYATTVDYQVRVEATGTDTKASLVNSLGWERN